MMLPELDEPQQAALVAVAALYLRETAWVLGGRPVTLLPDGMLADVMQRRDVCTLITEEGAKS